MILHILSRIRAVWHHYSTWALSALVAVGGLYEFVPAFRDDLPHWVMPVLAVAGLVGKFVPQYTKPPDGPPRTYADYRRDLPR